MVKINKKNNITYIYQLQNIILGFFNIKQIFLFYKQQKFSDKIVKLNEITK